MDESIIGCKSDKCKKRKEYLKDPDKPRGYCVGCMGLYPDELCKLNELQL